MIAFDTIKFTLPNASESFDIKNENAFKFTSSSYQGEYDKVSSLKDKASLLGISRVVHKHRSDTLEIEFSSKLLLENYHKGISLDTFDQLRENFDNDIFSLYGEWEKRAIIHRADASTFIQPKNLDTTLNQLDILRLNKKLRVTRYPTIGKAQTISFQGKANRNKFELKVYDKFIELNRSANRKFCDKVGAKYISYFIGKARVETKLNSHKDIKSYLEIDNGKLDNVVYLSDILESRAKPIQKSFEYIIKPQESLFDQDIYFMDPNIPLNQKQAKYGRRGIIKILNFDMEAISSYIAMHLAENTSKSRYLKAYREEMAEMIVEEKGKVEVINEMRELLKAV